MTYWAHKIYMGLPYDPEVGNFPEHRDRAVAVIRKSAWIRNSQRSTDLAELVDKLSGTEVIEDFDEVFQEIYDLADTDRCWIQVSPW